MKDALRNLQNSYEFQTSTSQNIPSNLQQSITFQNLESTMIQPKDANKLYFKNDNTDSHKLQSVVQSDKSSNCKSTYKKIIQKLQQEEKINKTCNLFYDTEFPAGIDSLMGDSSQESKAQLIQKQWDNIVWKRSKDFLQDQNYFFGERGIQSNKIKQGTLKNCYLLSTLACLAERPVLLSLFSNVFRFYDYFQKIKEIFLEKTLNYLVSNFEFINQICQVCLCVNGEWREVIIDDLFPVSNQTGKVLFEGQYQQDLWILLVEKAWAKINGGFIYLDMGMMRETLHDLTGAPCDNYFLENENKEDIWDIIYDGLQKGYCITCGTKVNSNSSNTNSQIIELRVQDHTLNQMGLVSSHAYSLLGAYVLPDLSKTKIIKLRNPWGNDKWKGKFSRFDKETWNALSKECKKELGYQKYQHDEGIIYMHLDDFYSNFVDLQVCMINDNYKYSSYKCMQQTNKKYFYQISIPQSGQYFITVNQQSQSKKQKQQNAGANQIQYSQVTIVLARWDTKYKRYVYIDGNQESYREVYTKQSKNQILKEGEYVLYVKANWSNQKESDQIVISSYGIDQVDILPIKPIDNFIKYVMLQHAMYLSENKKCLNQYLKNDFWICMNQMSEGYIYIAAWNNIRNRQNTNRIGLHRKNTSLMNYNSFPQSNNNNNIQLNKTDIAQLHHIVDINQQAIEKLQTFNCKFKIKNMNGLKLKKPFKDNLITFSLKPGQADIAIIKCKDLEQLESFDVEQQFIF